MANNIYSKIINSYKLNELKKYISHLKNPAKTSSPVFIFGCQRSGTTLVLDILRLSPRVRVYGEGDPPYFHTSKGNNDNRLKESSYIHELFDKENFQYILLKPLYESQHCDRLLEKFSGSRAIWVYRKPNDVIDSHVRYYKHKHDALKYIDDLFDLEIKTWKNEVLTKETIEVVESIKNRKQITKQEAYALFWLARNSLYFKVKKRPKVLLVNYEDIIQDPINEIGRIYEFLYLPFKKYYSNIIHSNSTRNNINVHIDPTILSHCNEVYQRLQNE